VVGPGSGVAGAALSPRVLRSYDQAQNNAPVAEPLYANIGVAGNQHIDENNGHHNDHETDHSFSSSDSYKLIVRAQDLGDPPKSNTTQVVINVLDVNDNEPRFPSTNYYQSVAENVPEGYSIIQVTAFDPDQGLNSKMEYSLRDTNPDLPFDIEKTSGWIHTTRNLDREVAGAYRFYVVAKDQGIPRSRSAISTVQISVLDRNDNDPVMSQRTYDIAVSESEPLGSEVLKVVATDPDENSEIRYEIVGGNVAHAFTISSRQGVGVISIAQPLDYNKEQFYR
jgi:cadherin EGF LAG seven-pass G-type receptor 1